MFLKLLSVEWTRLSRRALFWLTLVVCALFIWLSLENFYTLNRPQLFDGSLKLPGAAFDLANSLDQLILVELPFLVLIAGLALGDDYSQRTNQHWLMRGSRFASLLAKFSLLALMIFLLQLLSLSVGGLTGWYYKIFVYQVSYTANLNWLAVFQAPFYMTLATLPYAALMLLLVALTRSAFVGIAIGLGYTQFIEILLTVIFQNSDASKWLMRNLFWSATYSLNAIGNKIVYAPADLFAAAPAFAVSAACTLIFLAAAFWLYRRQDLGG